MLQLIRDRAKGWLSWIIVILIIIPFALWGIQEYLGGGGEVVVAEVNGVPIHKRQLEQTYYQQRQRLQQVMGENFRPELFPEARLKRQVLQQMVEREYVAQAVRDRGFRVSDEQLAMQIRNIDAFRQDGRFSREAYERVLRSQGMTPAAFEAGLRADLVAGQFQTGVAESGFATDPEVNMFVALQQQKRDLGYFTFPLSRFAESVEISDEDVSAYYEANGDRFTAPEQVKVAYVELSLDAMAKNVDVSEEELKARYEARKENFQTPEERRARHILIEVDPGAGEAAEKEALAEAQEVLQKLRDGADFVELAKSYSDDPGSAEQGGDLGFFGKGVMDNAFEKAVFALDIGEISEPVRTSFGYHVIKLEAVRGGQVKPFAEVRDRLLREEKRSRAEPQYYEQSEQLANITFEQPDTLVPAAEALGLEVKESDWFSREGAKEGIAAEPEVVRAAFSPDVLEAGNNSQPVEIGTNHLAVVRVRDRRPERRLPLEEVASQIRDIMKKQKARDAATAAAREAADAIASGKAPGNVAQSAGSEWKSVEGVTRNAADGTPAPILRAAFAMPRPVDGTPRTRVVPLRDGDQAVVALLDVNEPAAEPDQEAVRQQAAMLEDTSGEAEFAATVEGIRDRSDISIKEKNI